MIRWHDTTHSSSTTRGSTTHSSSTTRSSSSTHNKTFVTPKTFVTDLACLSPKTFVTAELTSLHVWSPKLNSWSQKLGPENGPSQGHFSFRNNCRWGRKMGPLLGLASALLGLAKFLKNATWFSSFAFLGNQFSHWSFIRNLFKK